MKNIVLNGLKLILATIILFEYVFIIPVNAQINESGTLADLKKDLKKLEKDAKEQAEKEKLTESQISSNYQKYEDAGFAIENARKEVEKITLQIDNTTEKIEKLKNENESILILMQKMENENILVSYLTGANSVTELVMRLEDIKQVSEYNAKQIDSLDLLIKSNEKLSKELTNYQLELEERMVEYQDTIKKLQNNLASIQEGAKDINEEIADMKSTIKMYENMGCKDNDKLSSCIDVANNKEWAKPLEKGVTTSLFGWRIHPVYGTKKYHNGIDIGGNNEGTKIYATANGTVALVSIPGQNGVKTPRCGGKIVYIWVYVNNVPYTIVYMHLLDIYVKEGQKVTTNTVIGTVGGGKKTSSWEDCSTGAHLHYGVSKNNHYTADLTQTYSKFTANYIEPPGFPDKNEWFYGRY